MPVQDNDCKVYFLLKSLFKKITSYISHIAYLDTLFSQKCIPRGLSTKCAVSLNNLQVSSKIEQILKTASLNIMRELIEFYKRSLSSLLNRVKSSSTKCSAATKNNLILFVNK